MADVLGAVVEVAATALVVFWLSEPWRRWAELKWQRWALNHFSDRYSNSGIYVVSGLDDRISRESEQLANWLFPPQIEVTSSPALATHGSTANLPRGRGDCGIAAGY